MQLYFVRGNPKDGEAEELLRANGRDLSKPHKIIAFVLGKDGAPAVQPLIDITDEIREKWGLGTMSILYTESRESFLADLVEACRV
jgi:hypothetical protein